MLRASKCNAGLMQWITSIFPRGAYTRARIMRTPARKRYVFLSSLSDNNKCLSLRMRRRETVCCAAAAAADDDAYILNFSRRCHLETCSVRRCHLETCTVPTFCFDHT